MPPKCCNSNEKRKSAKICEKLRIRLRLSHLVLSLLIPKIANTLSQTCMLTELWTDGRFKLRHPKPPIAEHEGIAEMVSRWRTIIVWEWNYCPRRNYYWINSEKGWSSNFLNFFTGINCFRTDSSNLSCKKGKAWKLLERIINSRQGLSRNEISNFSEINSWKHFSGSAIILVPTVLHVRYFRNPCDRDPPTRNFKNFKFFKNSLKILNVYFWGTSVYFWGTSVYFWG